ncbi:MAG: reverse transcriptase family protein [Proteobacteria bacterium]|nr:reverse transcriptase family protein [Pseudomonadota bacterium]
MKIPKKNPVLGYRIVYKVNSQLLKGIHKVLYKYLNEVYKAPECVHGFVPGRGTKTNATEHLGKKKVFKLDIHEFFDSIREHDICEAFCGLGCLNDMAVHLAKATTINGKLAQGFNTSPVLANIVFKPLDEQLNLICNKYHCKYTRYADDMTISSDCQLPPIRQIETILSNGGFRLNLSKVKLMLRGEKQYVTGLTVFDRKNPRVPKRFKKKIRLQLYFLKKFGCKSYVMREMGVSEYEIENDYEKRQMLHCRQIKLNYQIKGWIDYVNSIEPTLARKHYEAYNAIEW